MVPFLTCVHSLSAACAPHILQLIVKLSSKASKTTAGVLCYRFISLYCVADFVY